MENHMVLEGEHIYFRKAREEDYICMFHNIYSQESVSRYMMYHHVKTLEAAKQKVKMDIVKQRFSPYSYYIMLKKTDEPIGFAGVDLLGSGIVKENGIAIGEAFQGKGYGKEALALLLKLAFLDLNAERFIYSTLTNNEKSIRLCQQFGFHYFRSKQEYMEKYNQYRQIDYYHLSKEQYFQEVAHDSDN